MKVSIITPTLNTARHLQASIDSIQNQTYPNIEHIVIDGESSDGTLEILLQNVTKFDHWKSEPDRGMYDAINKGLALATGEIVGVLNGDDRFAANDVIQSIVKQFEQSDADAVYGDLQFISPDDENHVYRIWKSKPFKRSDFQLGWMPPHPTFYIKRKYIEQYGFYENHYFTAADYEFMCRYLFKHGLSASYLPKLLVEMRRGGLSNGNIWKRLRANRRDYLAMKANGISFPLIASVLKPISKLNQFKLTML